MRTIIVGDVHGCSGELATLLDRVAFASGDRLVCVGDLVARGPDSPGVLDIVRQTGALVVRGNHEQTLLDWLAEREGALAGRPPGARRKIDRPHRELARALRPIDWSLLQTSRVYLDLPEHDVRVVHAGVEPDVALAAQRPDTLMRIRTVLTPDRRRGERHVLWGTRYAGPPHVVFGHNARPGLQLHPWATGLDTGCVYGGRLTALVLGEREKIPPDPIARKQLLVSVPARRVWYAPRAPARAS